MITRNVGKKTDQDWHESFLALEQRYMALKKDFNAQEETLRLTKAAGRRAAGTASGNGGPSLAGAAGKGRPSSASSARGSSAADRRPAPLQTLQQQLQQENRPHLVQSVASASVAHPKAIQTSPMAPRASGGQQVTHTGTSPLKSPRPQSRAKISPKQQQPTGWAYSAGSRTTAAGRLHQQQQHQQQHQQQQQQPVLREAEAGLGSSPFPESMMVWGSEQAMQHAVQCNALMQVNDALRNRLGESDVRVKQLEHDLGTCRQVVSGLQSTLDENRSQAHQLVRQRDLSEQKLSNANHHLAVQLEGTQNLTSEHDKVRFSLEAQIKELRSRLVMASDNGDALSKDLRGVLSELRERHAQVAGLQSQVRVTDASLSSQRHTNDSILVELRGLNEQLTSERKKVLGLSRDLQVSQLHSQRVVEMEEQVRTLLDQRRGLEQESLRMVSELTESNTRAFKAASEEMKDRLGIAEQGVTHWQHVGELLYREIGELTAAHLHCRGECDEAKKERDLLDLQGKKLTEELQLCQAKLEIVWPSHRRDTRDMDLATMTYAFQDTAGGGGRYGAPNPGSLLRAAGGGFAETAQMLARTDITPEEHVRELQEANTFLVAEVEVMRTTNGLLTERLHALLHSSADATKEKATLVTRHDVLEDAGRKVVAQQMDRIRFLEQQVLAMKGVKVSPNTSLATIGGLENILEVFIGQLISAQVVPPGLAPDFRLYFCTVDFLVHETVTSPTLTGLNGFLDTTVAYCASMDALLVYYLRTRGLVVQLHRVTTTTPLDGTTAIAGSSSSQQQRSTSTGNGGGGPNGGFELVAEGFASLWELVAGDRLRDQRPALRGHIPLYAAGSQLMASIEFGVTARAPFSQHFIGLCVAAAEQAERTTFDTRLAANTRMNGSSVSAAGAAPADQSLMSAGPSVSLAHVGGPHGRHVDFIADPPGAVSIAVRTLALPKNTSPVPRLSCFVSVSALQADAFLPAPATAQFAVAYGTASDSPHLAQLPVGGLNDVLALLREPVVFFFFDETSPQSAAQHWAVAVWDLASTLTAPTSSKHAAAAGGYREEAATLSLTSHDGTPAVGEVTVVLQLHARSSSSKTPTGAAAPTAQAPQPPIAAALPAAAAVAAAPPRPMVVALESKPRTLDEELMAEQLLRPPMPAVTPAAPHPPPK